MRRLALLLLMVLLLFLAACTPPVSQDQPTQHSPAASVTLTTDQGTVLLEGGEYAPLFDEMLRSGTEETLDTTLSLLYRAEITYEDNTRQQFILLPDPQAENVWYIADGKNYRATRQYAEKFLELDALAGAYLDPLGYQMEIQTPLFQETVLVSSYSFTYLVPTGWKDLSQVLDATLPDIHAANLDDLELLFSHEPDQWNMRFLDEEGRVYSKVEQGSYICSVVASYKEPTMARYSGTVCFSFRLTLHGEPTMTLSSPEIGQGETMALRVENTIPQVPYHLYSTLSEEEIPLYATETGYAAFLPIAPGAQVGNQTLFLSTQERQDGLLTTGYSVSFALTDRDFRKEDVEQTPEMAKILTKNNNDFDREAMRQAKSQTQSRASWSGPFRKPLDTKLVSPFGEERYLDRVFSSRHLGMDFASAPGREVLAAADGQVVFSGELKLAGNTVIVDHGMGVFSGYSHLGALKVQVGDIVETGAVLGLTGTTGYTPGDHLHFTVSIGTTFVDPQQFFDFDFSAFFTKAALE